MKMLIRTHFVTAGQWHMHLCLHLHICKENQKSKLGGIGWEFFNLPHNRLT